MKKRNIASKWTRIVSILGIISLLILQWFWWKNVNKALEVDFINKAQEALIKASDKAIMYQMDSTSTGIRVVNELAGEHTGYDYDYDKAFKKTINSVSDMSFTIEEFLNISNKPLTEKLLSDKYSKVLEEKFGYIPEYNLKIFRKKEPISVKEESQVNRVLFGEKQDTILHQFGYSAYTMVVFQTPNYYFVKKGSLFLAISIVMVLLIGAILIFQYINAKREYKFAEFIIDYTRMITHELRTPVTGTQMVFKMLQKIKPSDTQLREKYEKDGIDLTKKVLLNLDNILYMAKSEQRELSVNWMEVNIQTFIEGIVDSYRERDFSPKTLRIETLYSPTDFKCRMDVKLMENAICNLLDNAIKYTFEDTRITVDCRRDGDLITIKVKDNGMGISEVDQKRIFGLFEQGSMGKNQMFPGFGIGLHFVERVVKAHGGKITVQSALDKGTEFTIKYTSKEVS